MCIRDRALLEPCQIAEHLATVVTSADLGVAKPDPAPLLHAAAQLGLTDPSRILYLGNSRTDAQAAAAAGMHYVDASAFVDGRILPTIATWIERNAGHRVERARAEIVPTDATAAVLAGQHHDRLTKPRGSMGRVESLGVQLAAIAGVCPPPVPEPAAVVVFAADHGVADAGVTIWPQEVTAQMVANFCRGGAAINVLARHTGASVTVVDVGVATSLADHSASATGARFIDRKVRFGTADLSLGPALNRCEALLALDVGVELAQRSVDEGARCLITGDMGIGNTTAAAAVVAAVTGRPVAEVTGRGAGADERMLERKISVITDGLQRLWASAGTIGPLSMLEELGGLEIAALAGFIIGGASRRVPVVVDGVIAVAGLLIAHGLAPDVRSYVVAGHRSTEPGASAGLAYLGLEPLLDLEMRLGEGTGAILALPIIQAAAKLFHEMATFDAAGIGSTTPSGAYLPT
ncbi:MAG: nicotinate-nucleotide--dimethylbenzimidazole phosphoribosyltransferase, partial [Acidimicrobiales bacterium]|nr:nicotinate-nucleotide--dimethylbenzimidazole phosphoribosyltransferase [Acidimicrobiales bacterium]